MKKILWPLLLVSFLGNLALALLLAVGAGRETAEDGASRTAKTDPAAKPSAPIVDATVWPGLKSDQFPDLVKRLRAAGFPPEIVRAILQAQINELFRARMKALDPDANSRPFWKRTNPDPKVMAAQRQLYREQEKLLKDLLGSDAEATDPMQRFNQERRFGPLPPEKLAFARDIIRDFGDKRSDVYNNLAGGTFLPADQARIAALDKEQRAALARVLSPQELEDFDLRSSSTAQQLRYTLTAFDATEQEFRTLYQVQKNFEDRLGPLYGPLSPEESRRRNETQKELTELIKATLGPQRYADYERATDYNYRTTSQLVARLELPPATINEVWTVQKDFQARATDIMRNAGTDVAARTENLA